MALVAVPLIVALALALSAIPWFEDYYASDRTINYRDAGSFHRSESWP